MGLKESLRTEWKNRCIEYKNKKLWVVEQFDYEGTNYLYVADEETLESDIIDVAFLYKVKDDIFTDVTDDDLFMELSGEVAGILAKEQILKIKKEYNLN